MAIMMQLEHFHCFPMSIVGRGITCILSSVYKYFPGFSGAREVFLYIYLCDPSCAGEAWEVFKNTFLVTEKNLYTLFRHRRSAYILLSGAGEVFIYTPFYLYLYMNLNSAPSR